MERYKIEFAAVVLSDYAVLAIGAFCLPVFEIWLAFHLAGAAVMIHLAHTSVECSGFDENIAVGQAEDRL